MSATSRQLAFEAPASAAKHHALQYSSSHSPATSQSSWGAAVQNSYALNDRIIRERIKLTNVQVRTDISAVLYEFPAKKIAKAAGSSVQTAENARQGHNAMSLTHFLNACRAIPELRALAMELMGCEGAVDPEFERGMHHLINAYSRRGSKE